MTTIDEVLDVTAQVLLRCTLMGVMVLLFWWGALAFFGDLAYAGHSAIVPLPREQFDYVHYVGILTMKGAISLLLFLPCVAIRMVIQKRMRLRPSV